MKNLHKNIKKYRLKNGLTQKELADKLSFSKQQISNWENGKGSPFNYLEQIAEALDVDIESLIGTNNKEEPLNTYSITVEHFKSPALNSFDLIVVCLLVFTLASGLINHTTLYGLSFVGWLLFLIYGLIIKLNNRKNNNETIYYKEDQKVVFKLKDISIEKLKGQLLKNGAKHFVVFMGMFLTTIIIMNFFLQEEAVINSNMIGFIALGLIFSKALFLFETYRFKSVIQAVVDFEKMPPQFGYWRYQLIALIYILTFIATYIILLPLEQSLLIYGLDSIVFIVQFLAVLVMLLLNKEYLNIMRHYKITRMKK